MSDAQQDFENGGNLPNAAVEHPVARETMQATGRRRYRRRANGLCPCGKAARHNQRDCDDCHAARMRAFRLKRKRETVELIYERDVLRLALEINVAMKQIIRTTTKGRRHGQAAAQTP